MKSILIINGPNLNLLGIREPNLYGHKTLQELEDDLEKHFKNKCKLTFFQSNAESEIVERIHSAFINKDVEAVIINAGAYTHTSIAIRDAFSATSLPFIEVHLSNVHAREKFRHKSYLSDKAIGVIAGLGFYGYRAAIDYLIEDKNGNTG